MIECIYCVVMRWHSLSVFVGAFCVIRPLLNTSSKPYFSVTLFEFSPSFVTHMFDAKFVAN